MNYETEMMILEARFINKAIDRYKDRWGFYPVNTDAFVQSMERHGTNLAVAVGH